MLRLTANKSTVRWNTPITYQNYANLGTKRLVIVINPGISVSHSTKKNGGWVFQTLQLIDTGIKIGFLYDCGCAVHYLYGFLLQAVSATKWLGGIFQIYTKKEQNKKKNKSKGV